MSTKITLKPLSNRAFYIVRVTRSERVGGGTWDSNIEFLSHAKADEFAATYRDKGHGAQVIHRTVIDHEVTS